MDGKEVLRKLRIFTRTPVIVLSARDRESEKIAALDLGADDYVEKPFAMGELLARMRTALRHSLALEPERVVGDTLVVNVKSRLVTKNGAPVKLTPKEFDLLAFLARHAGRPLTHREILRAVWGPAHQDDSQYLRVFVGQLRAKIEDNATTPKIILTEPCVGYRFIDSE
jgi:two-component system KDP operon response regulator KdpE